jgi:Zn-finger protein
LLCDFLGVSCYESGVLVCVGGRGEWYVAHSRSLPLSHCCCVIYLILNKMLIWVHNIDGTRMVLVVLDCSQCLRDVSCV